MVEIIFTNKGKLSGIYSDETLEQIPERKLNRMLDVLNEPDTSISHICFNGNCLECYAGKLKITLIDYKKFKKDERFNFVFSKLKKCKVSKNTKIKGRIVAGLLTITSIVSVASISLDKNNKKKIIEYEASLNPTYSNSVYIDAGNYNEKEKVENVSKDKKKLSLNSTKTKENEKEIKKEDKKNVNDEPVISKTLTDFEIKDETSSNKAEKTRKLYYDIINKYATMYGLEPSTILAIATQERGIHSSDIDKGGAIGLMQIQVSVWDNKDIKVYNYNNDSYENIHITLDKLRDVNFNIKVGCAIYQTYLKQMKNNKIAAIQAYNMGPYSVNKIINTYCLSCGLTKDEVLESDDLGWLDFRNSSIYAGDSRYVEHVLRYDDNTNLSNGKIK